MPMQGIGRRAPGRIRENEMVEWMGTPLVQWVGHINANHSRLGDWSSIDGIEAMGPFGEVAARTRAELADPADEAQ